MSEILDVRIRVTSPAVIELRALDCKFSSLEEGLAFTRGEKMKRKRRKYFYKILLGRYRCVPGRTLERLRDKADRNVRIWKAGKQENGSAGGAA